MWKTARGVALALAMSGSMSFAHDAPAAAHRDARRGPEARGHGCRARARRFIAFLVSNPRCRGNAQPDVGGRCLARNGGAVSFCEPPSEKERRHYARLRRAAHFARVGWR